MNWEFFDKLRSHIAGLAPGQFNYGYADMRDDCGCVGAHVKYMLGAESDSIDGCGLLRRELGIKKGEAAFIYGCYVGGEAPNVWHLFGAKGIAEALRRLDLVASLYHRQVTGREQQFLMSCRDIACQPLEPESVAG